MTTELAPPPISIPAPNDTPILSVSDLNQVVSQLLEQSFPLVWVEGEISNLAQPSSGHAYFTLKDSQAQVRCALFKGRRLGLGFSPENGMKVVVKAKVSLYQGRGEFQLIIESMEQAGEGALRRAFEALKKRLQQGGLFNPERKRDVPKFPRCIGVITSPTGAALRDILQVLKRRMPYIPVIIYPTAVQGADAPQHILQALLNAQKQGACDTLIMARGGGSLEDLFAFNDETLARAIVQSTIPIITGIGHEIDFTIADFVADRRAPTPSAAAELATPDKTEWLERLWQLDHRLRHHMLVQQRLRLQTLKGLHQRLQSPRQRLQELSQRLDRTEQYLVLTIKNILDHKKHCLQNHQHRLYQFAPANRLLLQKTLTTTLAKRLIQTIKTQLTIRSEKMTSLARTLQSVSPLATLDRGYAIVTDQGAHIVRDAAAVAPNQSVHVRLAKGKLNCLVVSNNIEKPL